MFLQVKNTRALACVIRLAVRLHGLNVLALIRANLYVLAALYILRKYFGITSHCLGISYYLIPAIANKRRINALSVRLVGFISSHQLTDRKPLVWPLSVVFRCLPTDRIYFCLDNRVLCVGITLLFAPSASISHRLSYLQS